MALTVGLCPVGGALAQEDLPRYRDVARVAGIDFQNTFGSLPKKYLTETTGSGAAFLDFDGDGNLDVYLANGRPREIGTSGAPSPVNRLYKNLGNGAFRDVTIKAGVGDSGWSGGIATADYDNDGDVDLFVTNEGANVLLRNNGDGTFSDVTIAAGLSGERFSTGASFGDVDGDGFLDLYIAHYIAFDTKLLDSIDPRFCRFKGIRVMCGPRGLPGARDELYLNQRDGTFRDVSSEAGLDGSDGRGLGVVFIDFDDDGDRDLFVANDSSPDFLYSNDGSGRFENVALSAGAAYSMYGRAQAGMGADAGDFDEDGLEDLIVTNFHGDYNALRRNLGNGLFQDVSDPSGLSEASWDRLSWGVKFLDANLDGFVDLFIVNGHIYPEVDDAGIGESYYQPNQLLLNVPGPTTRIFEDVSRDVELTRSLSSRGMAVGDFDNDGDWDLLVTNINDKAVLLEDQAAHTNRWARLTVIGTSSDRNASAVAIRYEVEGRAHHRRAGSFGSYLSAHDPRVLLGLGTAMRLDHLSLRWPGGDVQELGPLLAGEDAVIVEGVGRVK